MYFEHMPGCCAACILERLPDECDKETFMAAIRQGFREYTKVMFIPEDSYVNRWLAEAGYRPFGTYKGESVYAIRP